MKRRLVVLVLLAACSSGGGAPASSAPSTTAAGVPPEAVDVCRAAVKDKLVSPETAKFDPGPVMNTAGESWQIRGTITDVNGLGRTVHIRYSCLVNPSAGSWVIGDVTVSPG